MHPKAIEAQARRLVEVARAAEPPTESGERDMSRRLISRSGVSCILSGKALEKHQEIIRSLLNESEWGDKFSEKHVTSEVEEILCAMLREEEEASPEERLAELAEEFNSFDEKREVYVPLEGLRLDQTIEIGAVSLIEITREVCDDLYNEAETIISISPNPPGVEESVLSTCKQNLEDHFLNRVCARYEVVAEKTRAKERAEDEVRRVIDLLRFSIPAVFSENQKVQERVGGGGWSRCTSNLLIHP